MEPHIAADAEFLGLVRHDHGDHFHFVVENRLARLDGRLYGGTAIAVSIAAAEQVTERSSLWMTTQFVSTVGEGTEIAVHVEVLAPGRRTNQVRVTGTSPSGDVVFASLGATGHHRDGGLAGEFENCPDVTPPSDGESWQSPFTGMAQGTGAELRLPPLPRGVGFTTVIELRSAEIRRHPDPGPGRVCLWVRRKDRAPITPALASYVADMVPMSVARACGVMALGTSLDNSIRIGSFDDQDPGEGWVLLDLRPHLAVGDYGHGTAHVWSEQGRLMATASQTAAMRPIDPDQVPWANAPTTPG